MQHSDQFCCSHSLYISGYWKLFPTGIKRLRFGAMLFHLVLLMLEMCGTLPSLLTCFHDIVHNKADRQLFQCSYLWILCFSFLFLCIFLFASIVLKNLMYTYYLNTDVSHIFIILCCATGRTFKTQRNHGLGVWFPSTWWQYDTGIIFGN